MNLPLLLFVSIGKGGNILNKMVVIIFSLFLLVGCNESKIERNTELESDFTSLISMVSDKSDSEININTFINFEWDKAFLITPYTTQEEIEKKIDVNFKDTRNIYSRDDIYLLVFLHHAKVVQYAELNRQQANFSLGELEYLTPTNDLIFVTR